MNNKGQTIFMWLRAVFNRLSKQLHPVIEILVLKSVDAIALRSFTVHLQIIDEKSSAGIYGRVFYYLLKDFIIASSYASPVREMFSRNNRLHHIGPLERDYSYSIASEDQWYC